ncbi:MAG: SsrA-binding protein SmpB [Actinobacteria bacterium]|nr:SsrA-binding protein SmpB [Actinomycetota bacterium]
MAKKKPSQKKAITNRRARFDYSLEDSLVVGIALTGAETKSLRRGHGQLRGAYVTVKDNELWLINATITGDVSILIDESDKTRARKLLAKRKEIDALIAAKQQGRTIVPLEILTQGRYVKLRIAVGKGKKQHDKRETIKRRTQDREARRMMR